MPTVEKIRGVGIALLAAACLVACTAEEHTIANPIWSDDAEEVMFIVNWHEIPRSDVSEAESDKKYKTQVEQYFRVPADLSSDPEPWGERRKHAGDAYFMRTAGYMVTSEVNGGGTVIRQFFLDGGERVIADSDDYPWDVDSAAVPTVVAVPSADGRYLAVLAYESLPGGLPGDGTVSVVDAEMLVPVVEQTRFSNANIIWRKDGRLNVYGGGKSAVWLPGTNVLVDGSPPPCKWPLTSSGYVAADGRIVVAGSSLDHPFDVVDEASEAVGAPNVPFGCGE